MPIRVPAGAGAASGAAGAGRTTGAGAGTGGGFAAGTAVTATGIDEQRIPVGRKRAVIAKRLSESKFTAPHYYLTLSVSIDALTESRRSLNQQRTARGESKLSLNAFLMKLTAEAIKRYPIINASWEESEIHVFGSIDIGLAVALDDGLITPVVRNCGGKGIVRIDSELQELIARARSGKLTPEEYTGATFSISNLGSYGIEEFTAIINPPASAILAVGAAVKQPVELDDGSVFFDNRMKITLSCDHRVIDGAVGAEFIGALKSIIEDPLHALI
jgi:pyruvate dehydrogenase E2 component (dihydrolipoamide acetyltransferase)